MKTASGSKIASVAFACLFIVGCGGVGDGCCGWSHRSTTGVGQVKRVGLNTPLVCPDYHTVDISMGVMREGRGSMSTHDMHLYIPEKDVEGLTLAAKNGLIVNFTYDTKRVALCVEDERLTSFSVEK